MIPPNSLFGLPNLAELLAFHYGKPAYYYYYNKNVTERWQRGSIILKKNQIPFSNLICFSILENEPLMEAIYSANFSFSYALYKPLNALDWLKNAELAEQ